jgi:formylglycine-generating enzyme required for sulfatase activity
MTQTSLFEETVERYLAARPEGLQEELILDFCKQLAEALTALHQQNHCYLALSLRRIVVDAEGKLHLSDMSQAPSAQEPLPLLFKRIAFLAPEQKEGKGDFRSDIFAFGILAYYLLVRRFPEGIFALPSACRSDLRLNWDDLITACLQQDPEKRPVNLLDQLPSSSKKPLLKPQELKRPEYEPDPAAVFQIDHTVAKYTPKQQEAKEVKPLLTEMVVIEGGTFLRGSSHGGRDEIPRHAIHLASYALDIHPVTNEQFVRFLEVLGGEKDVNNNDIIRLRESRIKKLTGKLSIESGYAKHPVTGVTWYGALAYAKWVGKRLPTEAEWEVAACGGLEEALYPTGETIERSQANFFSSDTTAVMSYPPNRFGLYDMAGNVYEWCEDWYSYNYYDLSIQEPDNPKGPLQGVYRVLRGGCWKSLKEDMRCAHRHRNNPGSMNRTCGFRCAADVV